MLRQPFSAVVSPTSFHSLWSIMWHVPLSKWKALVGVFNWILMSLLPSARGTPNDRFVKSMVNISAVQMGLDGWETASAAMRAALRFQKWLRDGGREARELASGQQQSGQQRVETDSLGTAGVVLSSRNFDIDAGRQQQEGSRGSREEALAAARTGKQSDEGGGRRKDFDEMDFELPMHPRTW